MQINSSLAINNDANLTRWQEIIVAKVVELIRVRFGKPPRENMKHKRAVIKATLSGCSNLLVRCLYAWALPNGNWLDRDNIDIWVPQGTVINKVQLGVLVGTAIVNVFAPSLQPMYRRIKLKSAGLAIGSVAGLESCHGLYSHCFPEFAQYNTIANIRKQVPLALGNAVGAHTSLSPGNATLAIALSASAPASGPTDSTANGLPASSSATLPKTEAPETDHIKAPRK